MTAEVKNEAVLNSIDFKELAGSCKNEGDLSYLTKQFMKNMIENMLQSESDEHLGYEKHKKAKTDNSRNGSYSKKSKK